MIEPTETESKETLDAFCDAMIQIAREAETIPHAIHEAPVTTPVRRLDQTLAARQPDLRWTPGEPAADRVGRESRPGAADSLPLTGRPMGPAWRLLVTEPLDGATNMAIDEALLRVARPGVRPAHASASSPGIRRRSRSATASRSTGRSIGTRARRLGIGLVRRPTGGSAILHEGPEREVTYSVVARGGRLRRGGRPARDVSRGSARGSSPGSRALGAPAELVPRSAAARAGRRCPPSASRAPAPTRSRWAGGSWSAARSAGSAARFLQHGAVMLGADPARLRAVFPAAVDPRAGMTTLAAALGAPPDGAAVVTALAAGLGAALGGPLERAGLSPDETALVETLGRTKYGTDEWTAHGLLPRAAAAAPTGAAR